MSLGRGHDEAASTRVGETAVWIQLKLQEGTSDATRGCPAGVMLTETSSKQEKLTEGTAFSLERQRGADNIKPFSVLRLAASLWCCPREECNGEPTEQKDSLQSIAEYHKAEHQDGFAVERR